MIFFFLSFCLWMMTFMIFLSVYESTVKEGLVSVASPTEETRVSVDLWVMKCRAGREETLHRDNYMLRKKTGKLEFWWETKKKQIRGEGKCVRKGDSEINKGRRKEERKWGREKEKVSESKRRKRGGEYLHVSRKRNERQRNTETETGRARAKECA